mmetsp:Transcript_10799/g.30361  ORF Transcript_10799/g.30361 Transcript_10799/m.30361 type:complete len:615 (-) Transcript_10799:1041-2885(-)
MIAPCIVHGNKRNVVGRASERAGLSGLLLELFDLGLEHLVNSHADKCRNAFLVQTRKVPGVNNVGNGREELANLLNDLVNIDGSVLIGLALDNIRYSLRIVPIHELHGFFWRAEQNLLPSLVNDAALAIENLVKVKNLFTDLLVLFLDRSLDLVECLSYLRRLDGHVLRYTEGFQHFCETVSSKNDKHVILEGEEEARSSGITLAAGAATKLVIDTATLVAISSHDVQTAILDYNLLFFVENGLIQILHRFGCIPEFDDVLRILLTLGSIGGDGEDVINVERRQTVTLGLLDGNRGVLEGKRNVIIDGAGEIVFRGSRGKRSGLLLANNPLIDEDRSHLDAGHGGRTATKQNISTTSGHVGRYRNDASTARLGNNLTLTSGIFRRCVEKLSLDPLFSKSGNNLFALGDGSGTNETRPAVRLATSNCNDFLDESPVACLTRLEANVGVIPTSNGEGGWHRSYRQIINLLQFVRICHGSTSHSRKTRELTKEGLVGYLGNDLTPLANTNTLLCLDTLMQAISPPTAVKNTAGEGVDNSDTALVTAGTVDNGVILVNGEQFLGLDGVRHIRSPGTRSIRWRLEETRNTERILTILVALLIQNHILVLFINVIVQPPF